MRLVLAAVITGLALYATDARAESPTHELARKHYELGSKLYEMSNYGEALVEFEKAYKLEPKPELVYNIARCYEVMAKLDKAIEHYELYLQKNPEAPNRAVVEARLVNLRRRQEQARPVVEKPPPTPPPVTPRATETPSRWKWTTGWVAVGLGGASLVTGIVFGVLAKNKADDFSAGVMEGRPYQELNEIDESGKRYETLQIVTLAVGGALAAAGGGLLLWDVLGRRERRASLELVPYAGPSGGGVAGRVRF